MADQTATSSSSDQKNNLNLDLFSCMLQPSFPHLDPEYVGIRRLLLLRKAEAGVTQRKDWRCNGKGYVAYRNYINRPRNWESTLISSQSVTPGKSGRWISFSSPLSLLYDVDSWSSSRGVQNSSQGISHRTSFSSSTSGKEHQGKRTERAYAFVGMHCIFDECKVSVTVLKFGHMSSDLLAYGASDGSLSVCKVSHPPSIIKQLKGHLKDVTDFDFSSNNGYIASTSVDKTIRVWDVSNGHCIRVIYGVSSQLCIRFHPVNNNFLSVGNANKEITVLNFSTGRIISKSAFSSDVTSMDHDHTGQLIFCGDAKGYIYSVGMDPHTGAISGCHRNRSAAKHRCPVTTVQYRTFSLLARSPVLLACTQNGNFYFFSVALEIQGYLTIRCSLKLARQVHRIRVSFCPLLSLERGEYVVSGSEDSNVYFYDLTRPRRTCVNKLQGHTMPVLGVAWNYGENLLASSDSGGTVIVWRRVKTIAKHTAG